MKSKPRDAATYFSVRPRSSRSARNRRPNNRARNEGVGRSFFSGTVTLHRERNADPTLDHDLDPATDKMKGAGNQEPTAPAHRFGTRPHDVTGVGISAQSGQDLRRIPTGDSPARTTPRTVDSRQPWPSQELHGIDALGSVMPTTISWREPANHYSD
ncbi:hypothetical protein Psuf_043030 [Phytohabitans suffuscus]|uniref:Uncharacterized protein n=1 Tax=Phytohabitans suffuscus TaxID=624315 RepID=A0A6F8YLL2_9ACTN|nr:hypothetical protein Psuf_043030 [Phytohabitans suffuscus]